MTVKDIPTGSDVYWAEISNQIRNRKYKPSPVRRVQIPKEDGSMRDLGIPTVTDRVIQQAMVQVLTPIYEPLFSETSYGFRPGRSCEMAILKALEYMNDGYEWIVDIDLRKFFDTVNHDKLISEVMKNVKDGEIVSLIRKFLTSGVVINHEFQEGIIGLQQGGNLSPLLSNLYLNKLDKELEARGLNFTRYADDCIILVRSSKAADRVMRTVTDYIENKLDLQVNVTKSKVSKPNDIKYLGFTFFKDKADGMWKAKPHDKSILKLKLKLKELTKRNWSINLTERLRKIRRLVIGWLNYYKTGVLYPSNFAKIDSRLRSRIRVIIWKQWKSIRKREWGLMKLGCQKKLAHSYACARQSYVRCADTFLNKFITNFKLKQRGLICICDEVKRLNEA
jgi:group II intron reverse transcriptase/maturase